MHIPILVLVALLVDVVVFAQQSPQVQQQPPSPVVDDSLFSIDQATSFINEKRVLEGLPLSKQAFDLQLLLHDKSLRMQEARARLAQLLAKKDIRLDSLPADVQSFVAFATGDLAAWADPAHSTVLWRSHPSAKPVQRIQRSGLSHFHAVVVLQHYLVVMATGKAAGMLDMTDYMHRFYSPNDLRKHIFRNEGGNSEEIAERILVPWTEFIYLDKKDDQNFVELFDKYGPALVSMFEVHPAFNDSNRKLHIGCGEDSNFTGRHAMLIVGHRKEGKELRLLVQNWWPEKQFFESDLEYLRFRRADINFVLMSQPFIPKDFEVHNSSIAENNMDSYDRGVYTTPCGLGRL